MHDFAWWSGLKLSDARLAILLAGKRTQEESVDGQRHWFSGSSDPSPAPRARAYILPAFDDLLVGYATRTAAIDPSHMLQVNAGRGILSPTIVVDGRVVGTWKRRIERREVVFTLAPFAALSKSKTEAVALALGRYARFLGRGVRLEERAARAG